MNKQNLKITFLDPSMYNLLPLWQEMRLRSGVECSWIITRESDSRDKLQALGAEEIIFDPGEKRGKELDKLVSKTDPDVIISSTWSRADSLFCKIPKVQAFHALGNKQYFLKPELAVKYDLLLFPSQFHKNLYVKHRVFAPDDSSLQVVGWPRIDCFKENDRYNRTKIMNEYGLDLQKKNIFYAPTWGVYGPHGIFYRWFENQFEIFHLFCQYIEKLQANLIVKFHPLLQKPFMENEKFWQAFKTVVEQYDHLILIDALQQEDPQSLLYITDVLVTDISSIFVDYLALNRPVVFIEPQLDYWEQTEICSSYRTGYVVNTPQDLCNSIEDSLQNPARYEHDRKRLFGKLVYKFDGLAARRGVDAILSRYQKGVRI